ncbi:hypothetical protein HSB1_32750 [Halogranum salarium B-1]|uniref:Uncharacterized protein n=1 Tax=Halogranum salarium B-1 TaxID=1210908 RepID=J2ZXW1_9EURY|nr:hypothetical protein HSB1_32750 [Halogranum salarium B-1]
MQSFIFQELSSSIVSLFNHPFSSVGVDATDNKTEFVGG